jgi:hypothetical protein
MYIKPCVYSVIMMIIGRYHGAVESSTGEHHLSRGEARVSELGSRCTAFSDRVEFGIENPFSCSKKTCF